MASFYKEGSKITYEGVKGVIIKITETYRKNVLVVKVVEIPKRNPFGHVRPVTIGLFEYPTGKIEFMNIIDYS